MAFIEELTGPEKILEAVQRLGFLPFFKNEIPGFSIAEHTPPRLWFSDTEEGPWEWKGPLARTRDCVYGKFFRGRAGFISRDFFPVFANFRRRGYDFDALYDDGFAARADKRIYDTLAQNVSLPSRELKRLSGFGKDGEKGFDTRITRLQMQCYVVIGDFDYMRDRFGKEYGWGVARYTTPEALFGEDFMEQAYREDPDASKARVIEQLRAICPEAGEKQIIKLLGAP
jgi:hypothetical protein